MARNIAADTLAVGNALSSVRIDNMILNLAKGIAWGQYELDKVGVDITKMMGVPGTVSIGGEAISMLEAGFIPSFYHFVDTILELKMEVSIREEHLTSISAKTSASRSSEVETGGSIGVTYGGKVEVGIPFGSASGHFEMNAKAHWNTKTTSAYSRSLEASHSQKFSQDLSASSLMRTKIVPIPPPELLVERIKILLERLREDAENEDAQNLLFSIPVTEGIIQADGTLDQVAITSAFSGNSITLQAEITIAKLVEGSRWTLTHTPGRESNVPANFVLEKNREGSQIKVYRGAANQNPSLEERLMSKINERLMERMESV